MGATKRIDSTLMWTVRIVGLALLAIVVVAVLAVAAVAIVLAF